MGVRSELPQNTIILIANYTMNTGARGTFHLLCLLTTQIVPNMGAIHPLFGICLFFGTARASRTLVLNSSGRPSATYRATKLCWVHRQNIPIFCGDDREGVKCNLMLL
jgi:hypothetical protein